MQLAVSEPATETVVSSGPSVGLVLLGAAAAVLVTLFVRRAARAPALQSWAPWFNPLLVIAWLGLGWLGAQRMLATDSTPKAAVRVALVVVVLVIAAPLLRDLLAAMIISLEGRHRLGDDLRVAGLEGRVVSLGLRAVVLRRRDGSECSIPNNRFVSAEVVRLNLPSGEAPFEFEVRAPPGVDLEVGCEMLVEACVLSPFAAPGSLPEVFVADDDDDPRGPRLRVRAYVFDRTYEERYRSDILARLAHWHDGSHPGS